VIAGGFRASAAVTAWGKLGYNFGRGPVTDALAIEGRRRNRVISEAPQP
jgi:hypothetical protein